MWIIYAFGSAVFAGVTAILAKCGIKKTDSNVATAIRTVVVLIFAWLLVFAEGSEAAIKNLDKKTVVFLLLSGLATGASWLFYFRALQIGDVNKVTPIDKSSTVITMLFAFFILGETVTRNKLAGMAAISLGTYMMIQKDGTQSKETADKKWFLPALCSALFASLSAIFGKIGITGVESNLGTAIRTIVVLIMAWIVVFVSKKANEIKTLDKKSWLLISLSGITTGMSWLCYYRALQNGEASIVVPIDKLSIVLTIAFSYFFLKERLSKKSFAGLILLVSGTLMLLIR